MRLIACALMCALLSACAAPAMRYVSQPQVQSTLRNGDFQPAAVDPFDAATPKLESLTMRGNPLKPASGTFSGDLATALKIELDEARLLDDASTIRIDGRLLRNELSSAGFATGSALIEAEFVVAREGSEVYRSVKQATHQWESSFAGAKAIPAAMQGYLASTQKLIATLIEDPQFQQAIQ